jgi:hypothetical protein
VRFLQQVSGALIKLQQEKPDCDDIKVEIFGSFIETHVSGRIV